MDARTRTLLEAIAFGDGNDLRPADRLRAAELLEVADDHHDARAVAIARVFEGTSEADLRADVDEMAAAHVLDAWHHPDQWPAVSVALRRILWEAGDSPEARTSQDRSSVVADRSDTATNRDREAPAPQAPELLCHGVTRHPGEPVGVDPASGFDVGWRPYS